MVAVSDVQVKVGEVCRIFYRIKMAERFVIKVDGFLKIPVLIMKPSEVIVCVTDVVIVPGFLKYFQGTIVADNG